MTALLTSQGIPKEIKQSFLSLLKKPANEYKVAFITTAALDRGDENPSWLEFYREELRNVGISDIENIDLRKFDTESLKNKLKGKDIIYVNGGNTYFLMKYVKESGFGELLPQLLEQKKLYVGVSAGSVIMGPDVSLASWIPNDEDVNDDYVADTKGLNLVPFAMWPHFQEIHKQILVQKKKDVPYAVIALNNTQAILCKNKHYSFVGKGNKYIFTQDFASLLPVDDWTEKLEQLVLDIAKTAEKEEKQYYLGGGLALDIAIGRLTRFHEDIAFYPFEEDKDFWKEWFTKKGYRVTTEPWTSDFPNAYVMYSKDNRYAGDIYPIKSTTDTISMLWKDGSYGNWEGKSWKDTKVIHYKGQDIRIENPDTVLSQKIEEHKGKGSPMREKDLHDFALFNKTPQ